MIDSLGYEFMCYTIVIENQKILYVIVENDATKKAISMVRDLLFMPSFLTLIRRRREY